MSDFLDKAKDLAGEHADTVKQGVDAATDKVDDMTGGKSAAVTEKVDDAAASAIDKLAEG
jgi:uncharacterized protein YbjQ (UPF0145 family)